MCVCVCVFWFFVLDEMVIGRKKEGDMYSCERKGSYITPRISRDWFLFLIESVHTVPTYLP